MDPYDITLKAQSLLVVGSKCTRKRNYRFLPLQKFKLNFKTPITFGGVDRVIFMSLIHEVRLFEVLKHNFTSLEVQQVYRKNFTICFLL